ncbi:MAG TPA: ATP-binding protein [Chloroflexota bacterium]|nr:ATP-binding protein [Chloroflexota bacterium]
MSSQDRLRALAGSVWAGYCAALCMVAIVSLFIGLIRGALHVGNLSMLYLVAVLAAAIAFGRGPAVLVSVTAFLTFNWFFVEPLHSFWVSDPGEWIALLLLLMTAVLTGQLAAAQRLRAEEAEQRKRDAIVLYDVVRLISATNPESALKDVAERLRRELDLSAVAIELSPEDEHCTQAASGDSEAIRTATGPRSIPAHLLEQGSTPTALQRGQPGRWVRIVPPHSLPSGRGIDDNRVHLVPVKAGDKRVGELILVTAAKGREFSNTEDRLLSTVAAQIGLAVERLQLRKEATDAEVLRRADALKTALLNAVSHDLRTPLASIIASAGSLLQNDVAWTDQEREEFAETIESEAQRLNRIVGNLLDLSRIKAGTLQPEKGWYDIESLVEEVLGRLSGVTAGHTVRIDIPEDLPPVLLDYVEIDEVLSNLVENSAKFAPPKTEIRIGARNQGREIRIEVENSGPGIQQDTLPLLFEPFYRGGKGDTHPQGTGLGLAVAKGLVEAHGGRIWAENRAEGGARFVFTLPLLEETPPREGPVEVMQ